MPELIAFFRGWSVCHPILTAVRPLVLAISAQSVRIFGSDALNHTDLYAFSKTVPFPSAPGIWTYPSNAPKCAITFEKGISLQFRAEATNAFNLVSLSAPTANLASSLNGKITAADSPRLIQLGLRLTF